MDKQTSSFATHYQRLNVDTKNILSEFTKPIQLNVFFNNLEYLTRQSDLVLFDKDLWKLRPNIFCFDHYENQNFYPVILLVNGLSSMFEFLPENLEQRFIFAPKKRVITGVLSLAIDNIDS